MTDSFARLHPAGQFVYYAIVLGLSMVLRHPATVLIAWLGVCLALLPHIDEGKRWRTFLLPFFFAIPTTILNALFRHYGVHVLWTFPSGNWLTLESILDGAQAGLRLGVVMLWFIHMYKSLETDRILYLFSPFPVFSLLLTLTLGYLPRFSREAEQLAAVQKVADGETTAPLKVRFRRQAALLASLSGWALESSIVTADAMQARGLGISGRKTRYQLYRWSGRDSRFMGIALVLTATTIWLTSRGHLDAAFHPFLYLPRWNSGDLLVFILSSLLFCFAFLINLGGTLRWHYSQQNI